RAAVGALAGIVFAEAAHQLPATPTTATATLEQRQARRASHGRQAVTNHVRFLFRFDGIEARRLEANPQGAARTGQRPAAKPRWPASLSFPRTGPGANR